MDVTEAQAVLDSDGLAVTSNGEALTRRDNGNGTLDAVLGNGDAVFRIKHQISCSLEANGSASVDVVIELYQSIDQWLWF
ncbi:hypothetical protein OK016_25175 [Vibrio chagasii]|nr:hypothetical protein [Vibrio chagasii]